MNLIDELSKLNTTQEIVRHYRKQGHCGMVRMANDMKTCSLGNRRAIEALIGQEIVQYQREVPERPLDENTDIVSEIREG